MDIKSNMYESIRPDIKSGQLVAWTHRKWKTWYDVQVQLVRVFTQSEYCHVGITWKVEDRVFVIEAVKPIVRIFELSKLLPFYWLPVDVVWDGEPDTKYLLDMVGTRYPSNTRQVLQNVFRRKLEDDGSMQCAQLAHRFLAQNGMVLGDELTPSALVRSAQTDFGVPCYVVK